VILFVVIAFVVGYSISGSGPAAPSASSEESANTQYTCSMHPEVRMPNPDDKCPICHMALIPVGSSDSGDGLGPRQIKLSSAAQAMINVETTPVVRRLIAHNVNMVGQVEYDETRLAYITSYVDGRLDRLFVDYTGIEVRKQDHLAEIYSPELLVSLTEIHEARQTVDRLGNSAQPIVREAAEAALSATRERLRLLGLTQEQIESAEAGQFKDDHITLYAPIGGIVIEKNAKQGSFVKEGDRIYTIADLSKVWVMLEAYESDLPWLRYGQKVRFTVQPFGDEVFEGTIAFIAPVLDRQQRTVQVRVNVDNADGRLRPGMFVRGAVETQLARGGRVIAPDLAGKWVSPMHPEVVRDKPGDCPVCGMDLVRAEDLGYVPVDQTDAQPPLIVPDSAVLRTGKRGIVYLKRNVEGQAVFEGRQVELGPRGDGFFIVESGLDEGDLVVTRGNFQIDSALQIEAKPSMMNPTPGNGGKTATGHEHHTGAQPTTTQPGQPIVHLHGPSAAKIRDLLDAYLALSTALAGDDAEKSKAAITTVATALKQANAAEYSNAFAKAWSPVGEQLTDVVKKLSAASDIAEMRVAFQPLSNELIALLSRSHIESVGPIYRAHCPMAFDFTGASWLTREKHIRNPYFGAQMLKCGTIEQTLAKPPAHDHD
jgi:Cu(I)/Ag(I) efflux system membrane fusion protein